MSKRLIKLWLAGSFVLVLCIASIGSGGDVFAGAKKKLQGLAMEGPIFDLKQTTTGLLLYGYVSDRLLHPVEGATVTVTVRGERANATTNEFGFYGFRGIFEGNTYTVNARKSGQNFRGTRFTVREGETKHFIVNFQSRGGRRSDKK